MLKLLTALALALVEYLRLKNQTARYDLQRRIEDDIRSDEIEIASLRARDDDASHRRADRLRERIVRAVGVAGDLPAARAGAEGGASGADASGNLPPANG